MQFEWVTFPLHPETPEEGRELAELFAGSGYDLPSMQKRLATVALREGLPFGTRSRISNSRKAQELGKYAEKMGLWEPFCQSVYRAYFVEGKNIGNADELLTAAEQAGLSPADSRKVLEEGIFREPVDSDWRRARMLGISGVPAFVYGNRLMVGFKPYEEYVRLIQSR